MSLFSLFHHFLACGYISLSLYESEAFQHKRFFFFTDQVLPNLRPLADCSADAVA